MKIHLTTSTVFYLAIISGTTVVQHAKAGGTCQNQDNYQCGYHYPFDGSGNTCSGKGCCCHGEKGTGLQLSTCDTKYDGYTNRGCGSCWGRWACTTTEYMNIGTNACHGNNACFDTSQSTIESDSCLGVSACYQIGNSIIKEGACVGEKACMQVNFSTIGNNSCRGYNACSVYSSSSKWDGTVFTNLTIGNNACNGDDICERCESNSVVPNNACNDVNGDDVTFGRCDYCGTVSYICMFYPTKNHDSFSFF